MSYSEGINAKGDKKYKIMIGLPSNGVWEADMAWNFSHLLNYTDIYYKQKGIECQLLTSNTQGSLITKNRNEITRTAIEMDCTHVWFLDVDMMFPNDALIKFIESDKDIIGVNAVSRGADNFTARKDNKTVATCGITSGIGEVDHIGTGGMFFKIQVAKDIGFPYFFLSLNRNDDGDIDMLNDDDFRATGKEFAREVGEDYYFCQKALEKGYKIHIDQDISKQVTHIGKKGYTWKDYYIKNCFDPIISRLFYLTGLVEAKETTDEQLRKEINEYIDSLCQLRQEQQQKG